VQSVTCLTESIAASLNAVSLSESKAQISTLTERLPAVVMICSTIDGCRLGSDEGEVVGNFEGDFEGNADGRGDEGFSEGWLLCADDGRDDGALDIDGDSLGSDVGQCDAEGFSEGCTLGRLDSDGFIEGEPPLGSDDGCDVGQ